MYVTKSPVLFLIFNRPKETQLVFNSIKNAKPARLYVAADGPRENEIDKVLCAETKNILNQIDWDCELITLFRDQNLGCGKAVSSAILWFFKYEKEGIILEDDCLPSLDFFRFCDEMLEKYRLDDRIGHISGSNFQDGLKRGNADYYFSRLTQIWGWASWKRVWDKYDFNMSHLDTAAELDILAGLTSNKHYKKILYNSFNSTKNGEINTWDYQYAFLNHVHNRLSVIPNYNLISNIGFNSFATHTIDVNSPMSNVSTESLPNEIKHPEYVYPNCSADNYILEKEMPSFFQIKTYQFKSALKDFFDKVKSFVS